MRKFRVSHMKCTFEEREMFQFFAHNFTCEILSKIFIMNIKLSASLFDAMKNDETFYVNENTWLFKDFKETQVVRMTSIRKWFMPMVFISKLKCIVNCMVIYHLFASVLTHRRFKRDFCSYKFPPNITMLKKTTTGMS